MTGGCVTDTSKFAELTQARNVMCAAEPADRIVNARPNAPGCCMHRESLRIAIGKPDKNLCDAALEQLDLAGRLRKSAPFAAAAAGPNAHIG